MSCRGRAAQRRRTDARHPGAAARRRWASTETRPSRSTRGRSASGSSLAGDLGDRGTSRRLDGVTALLAAGLNGFDEARSSVGRPLAHVKCRAECGCTRSRAAPRRGHPRGRASAQARRSRPRGALGGSNRQAALILVMSVQQGLCSPTSCSKPLGRCGAAAAGVRPGVVRTGPWGPVPRRARLPRSVPAPGPVRAGASAGPAGRQGAVSTSTSAGPAASSPRSTGSGIEGLGPHR